MMFHENRLRADDFREISCLIIFQNWGICGKKLSFAAVVIGALNVNHICLHTKHNRKCIVLSQRLETKQDLILLIDASSIINKQVSMTSMPHSQTKDQHLVV